MWKKRENIDFLMGRLLYTLLVNLSFRMVHVQNYVPFFAVYSSNKALLTVGHCLSCGE